MFHGKTITLAIATLAMSAIIGSPAQVQEVLETPGYVVTITNDCEEGVVVCDRAIYRGVSKKSGKSITLRGSTMHTTCADGETPCRFLGWRFVSPQGVIYEVFEDGTLIVRRGERILLRQRGRWR